MTPSLRAQQPAQSAAKGSNLSPNTLAEGSPHRLVIEPTRGLASLQLRAVWEYRELLYFLIWREVKGRYRQMAFGPLWIIIAPLIQMVIFSVLFGALAKLPSDGVPYPDLHLCGPAALAVLCQRRPPMPPAAWSSQQHIIAKVYFPRLVIPIVAVLSALVDFADLLRRADRHDGLLPDRARPGAF